MTKKDKDSPRSLVDICDKEDFRTIIQGSQYCSLGISKQIDCPRQSKVKDQNGFYLCLDIRDNYEGYIDPETTLH